MNSKNHDLIEFEDLITELKNPEVRPYAPHLPRETKEEMRRTLLTGQQHGLSRHAAKNLWKFAGTAVVALLFLFIIASFIAVLSNPSTQIGPQQEVVSPPQRTPSVATPDGVGEVPINQPATLVTLGSVDLTDRTIVFDDRVQLVGYQLEPDAEGTFLRLRWLPLAILDDRIHIFVHFIDEQGELVLQADGPPAEIPMISRETKEVAEGEILLPTNELRDGRFDIIIGLYNTETGERLSVTTIDSRLAVDNSTAVQIHGWSAEEFQDRIWLISVDPAPGTNLFDVGGKPTTFTFEIGYELGSSDIGYLQWGLEPVGNGELPHYVYYSEPQDEVERGTGTIIAEVVMSSTRPDGLASAVAPKIGLMIPDRQMMLPLETTTELIWPLTPSEEAAMHDEGSGDVWLISVVQEERQSADATIDLEITLGYEFESDEDVFIKLSYADADWENASDGSRLPIDGLENPIFLENNQGEVTINTTLNPNEAMQIVGSENPVLLVELGYIQEFEDERENVIRFLAHETFSDYPLDLTTTAAIQHLP